MIVELDVSVEEVSAGQLTDTHRQAALSALKEDGLVVLNDVVATDHLDILAAKMDEDVAAIRRLETLRTSLSLVTPSTTRHPSNPTSSATSSAMTSPSM